MQPPNLLVIGQGQVLQDTGDNAGKINEAFYGS